MDRFASNQDQNNKRPILHVIVEYIFTLVLHVSCPISKILQYLYPPKPTFSHTTPIPAKIANCSIWIRPLDLFSNNSNLSDHDTSTLQTKGQSDGRTDEVT